MKIYSTEDQSLIEYFSHHPDDFNDINSSNPEIDEYAKFSNDHHDFL